MQVRVGQTKATIYRTPKPGFDSFTVVWYEGAIRKRKVFADLPAAELHAQTKVNSLAHGEASVIHLSGEERLAYLRAKTVLKEFGVAVDSAALEYADAKRLVGGASILEAARFYARQRLQQVTPRTVAEVFKEMVASKRAEGRSERYIEDLESRVGKFAADFHCQIAAVSGAQIKEWIQSMKVANRTRNNFRLGVQTLFSFAKSQKYVAREWEELESVPVWKAKEEVVEIFTPAEMGILLSVADLKIIPLLAIGAFAGLRTAEIERLDWSKVNLATGYITVDASIAKTSSRRLVPISGNLRQWLEPHAKPAGPVVDLANTANAFVRLVDATRLEDPKNPEKLMAPRVKWRHNGLRHSFCSYRLAETQNVAQVALEAGNSSAMIFKHYRELVRPDEAKTWFAIAPEPATNVTPMPVAAVVG